MATYSSVLFFFFLPLYCYQPISLHPRAHMLSHVTPWTAFCQAPLSMDFSRQEYLSGLPFPSPHCSILAWRIPGTGAWWAAVYGVAQSRTQLM